MSPGRCHHWNAFAAKFEVVALLIVLDIACFEQWCSAVRIVAELTLGCGLEIGSVLAHLVVSPNLIQGVLVAHELIRGEIDWIFLFNKALELLGSEVLAPTSGMIPMRSLEVVLLLLSNDSSIPSVTKLGELPAIACLVAGVEAADLKIGLSHLLFFAGKIKLAASAVSWILPLRNRK